MPEQTPAPATVQEQPASGDPARDVLLPCPSCGRQPEASNRASGVKESPTGWVYFIACMCGGYSARAHQMGWTREEVTAKWNTRVAAATEALRPAPASGDGSGGGVAERIREIRARLAKIPPHFCTRGARNGGVREGGIRRAPEEACNTIMDHEGRVIADSLNADYRLTCIEEIDSSGEWREIGTLAYFDVFANAPDDLRFLLEALAAAKHGGTRDEGRGDESKIS